MGRLAALAFVVISNICLLWFDSASAQGVEAVDNVNGKPNNGHLGSVRNILQ